MFELKKGEVAEWKGLRYEAPLAGVYQAETRMRWDPDQKKEVPVEVIERVGPLPERE